jgi:hypothetical protein
MAKGLRTRKVETIRPAKERQEIPDGLLKGLYLVLLRHESFCLVGGNLRAQQGHRGRARASATISR